MRIRFWLRGGAALAVIGFMAAAPAAQARELTCTLRGKTITLPLRISDHQTSAAFGSDPASPATVSDDQIRWRGPDNERGYAATYVFDRNTGALVRMSPVLFDKGLTSMWPTTFDCAGAPQKVD